MRYARGFTLIEVLITITILVVLLVLAVVSMSDSEARARDEERRGDAESIARLLENYYTSGAGVSPAIGEYPSTAEVSSEALVKSVLTGVDPKNLRGPGLNSGAAMTFGTATNAVSPPTPTPSTALTSNPSTPLTYIYQPLTGANTLCTTATLECRKFNLYYTTEKDTASGAAGLRVITSRNQ